MKDALKASKEYPGWGEKVKGLAWVLRCCIDLDVTAAAEVAVHTIIQ